MDLRALLAAVEDASPVDVVDSLSQELVRSVDAHHVGLLIANFSGDALVRLSHVSGTDPALAGHTERAEAVPLAGTAHGRALFSQSPEIVRQYDNGWLALVPITERGDAIGLLEVTFADKPSDDVLRDLVVATHAWTYALIASRRHTDLFEWAQRDIPFSVSAEIQRRLLPSAYTLEAGPLTLAGWLEPSHDVGGDTFDYSLDRGHLYVSITDAMGHDTAAALLATLTVGAIRNRRRALTSPAEQADAANEALRAHARDHFVTGLLLRIRLSDGDTEIVGAGHPAPFLLRDGAVTSPELTTQLPLGLADGAYRTDHLLLRARRSGADGHRRLPRPPLRAPGCRRRATGQRRPTSSPGRPGARAHHSGHHRRQAPRRRDGAVPGLVRTGRPAGLDRRRQPGPRDPRGMTAPVSPADARRTTRSFPPAGRAPRCPTRRPRRRR